MSNIYTLLSAAMGEVGAVRKGERNQSQGFNFRGIDSVVNAVSPAFRKHGIIVFPTVLESSFDTIEVGAKRSLMGHVRVKVAYTFAAPDGTFITATVVAESMDSGDKAHAKAMSVAFRTALLQTLCLPTDEIDPDAESFERSPAAHNVAESRPARNVVSSAPRPAATGGLTRPQQVWVEKQAFKLGDKDPAEIASEIIGRTITSLNEVTADEARVLLPALSDQVSQ